MPAGDGNCRAERSFAFARARRRAGRQPRRLQAAQEPGVLLVRLHLHRDGSGAFLGCRELLWRTHLRAQGDFLLRAQVGGTQRYFSQSVLISTQLQLFDTADGANHKILCRINPHHLALNTKQHKPARTFGFLVKLFGVKGPAEKLLQNIPPKCNNI